jgi:hypothetical protein
MAQKLSRQFFNSIRFRMACFRFVCNDRVSISFETKAYHMRTIACRGMFAALAMIR